jgi:hypothetical protein
MKKVVFGDVMPCVLVRTDVSEEHNASIFNVKTMEAICPSETSVPTRTTLRHIPEGDVHQDNVVYSMADVIIIIQFNSIELNSIQFINMLTLQPEGQLQSEHGAETENT